MSMDYLQRQYLRVAYELAREDPIRVFDEDQVINELDVNPGEPGYAERIIAVGQDLKERGFVAPKSKGGGLGSRTLQLTRVGTEEAERLADPIEQRKEERSRFLRAVYLHAEGNPAEFVYWRNLAPEYALEGTERPPSDVMGLAEHLERSGLITIEANEGTMYRITARGIDEVEGNKPPEAGPTFQFYGPVQGSVIGTHNTAELTNIFDFRAIEQRIQEEGGEDKEELRRALAQIERLLERGEYLDRGALSQFSGVMERHSWFTGAVMQALLGFATQVAVGG